MRFGLQASKKLQVCLPQGALTCRSVSTLGTTGNVFPAHGVGCACGKCGGKPIHERHLASATTATNRGVIFMGPNDVQVKGIPFPHSDKGRFQPSEGAGRTG